MQIINDLVANGRASYASLGAAVGLSPHGAGNRVRRLVRAGVIKGFTTSVNLASVGRPLDAFIDVRLLTNTSPDHFESRATALAAVQELAFVTGRFDYHLRVACIDADDLDHTVRALRQDAGAATTETRVVLRATSPRHPLGSTSAASA